MDILKLIRRFIPFVGILFFMIAAVYIISDTKRTRQNIKGTTVETGEETAGSRETDIHKNSIQETDVPEINMENDDQITVESGDLNKYGENTVKYNKSSEKTEKNNVKTIIENFGPTIEVEAEKTKPVHQDMLYLATDIHYYDSTLTDFGKAFTEYMNTDDGKDIKDVEKTLDRWIEKVKEDRPAVIIISGDNTLNGEKKAHEDFANKLQELEDYGITSNFVQILEGKR